MKRSIAAFFVWGFTCLAGMAAEPVEVPHGLLEPLTSERFREREQGQAGLLAWARGAGEAAKDALLKISREAGDPEIRERSLAVLRDLVVDEYLQEGEGYIGIRMLDEFANLPGEQKPRGVIRVIQVVPDSAADKAGLQLNDLIAAVGEHQSNEGAVFSVKFSEKVRLMKPNSKVRLKILRNGNLMELDVTLGRRPLVADTLFFDQREIDLEAAEQTAKDAYFQRWLERRRQR